MDRRASEGGEAPNRDDAGAAGSGCSEELHSSMERQPEERERGGHEQVEDERVDGVEEGCEDEEWNRKKA